MEEYMTQQPQETSADVEIELETGSQALDAQPE
jgi:hypothetical protein